MSERENPDARRGRNAELVEKHMAIEYGSSPGGASGAPDRNESAMRQLRQEASAGNSKWAGSRKNDVWLVVRAINQVHEPLPRSSR